MLSYSNEYVGTIPNNLIGAYPPSKYNEYMAEWDKMREDLNYAIINIKNSDPIIKEFSLEVLR
jgi:hypothetical protein